MAATTNVPKPTFGPTGFIAPAESAILGGRIADITQAFGGNLNPALTTPQGQLATSDTAVIGNVYDNFVLLTQMTDPAFAFGRYQDAIGRIYFLNRIPAAPTVIEVACTGSGATILAGALIQDDSGNIYSCTGQGTLPVNGGTINLFFENLTPGPIAVPGSGDIAIYQAIPGWDTVTCLGGVLGNDVESQAAFEERRALSVAQNSNGSLPAVLGAVLAVAGVLDAYVTENDENTQQTIGGATLNPNSLYVAVVGGTDADVAQAIWSRKAPGCAYNGNTTVTVYDTSAGYVPPYPAYSVQFERPAALPIWFVVTLANNPNIPADAATQIQNAIINAFAGLDGGSRAKIGTKLFASRFYNPVALLGSWVQIISIEIGATNINQAEFTASISGNTMAVSAVASGTIGVGQALVDAAGNIIPGTVITADAGGGGGVGNYTINNSQSVGSGAVTSFNVDQFDVPVNIDQVPVVAAGDISVVVQ